MGRYYHARNGYLIELLVRRHRQFDVHDNNYIDGNRSDKPPDFNLHLALYLLETEHLPHDLLEPLEQWARDNKMVIR